MTAIHSSLKRADALDAEKISAVSTANQAQMRRLVQVTRQRPHHTHELRQLGISHPAGRVYDLEKRGYTFTSNRIITVDSDGYEHRGVALYALVCEPEGDPLGLETMREVQS